MARLRRIIEAVIEHDLTRVIDDGDSEIVPGDQYYNDDLMSKNYFTNDAKTNYYSSSD